MMSGFITFYTRLFDSFSQWPIQGRNVLRTLIGTQHARTAQPKGKTPVVVVDGNGGVVVWE